MPPSFLGVRLNAKESALMTSKYGLQVAESMPVRPFLAFKSSLFELRSSPVEQSHWILLGVSPRKPTGEHADDYFALNPAESGEERVLVTEPPVSTTQRLYLHLFPRIVFPNFHGLGVESANPPTSATDGTYEFERESFDRLCAAFHPPIIETHVTVERAWERATSGGDEPVQDDWQTWSGPSEKESGPGGLVGRPWTWTYDLVKTDDWTTVPEPTITQELLIMEQ